MSFYKKIFIFCPYYPPHVGGLESHADEFNKYLSKEGYEITVFTPRLPKDALEIEKKYNNVKIFRFPAFEIIPNFPVPCFWRSDFWKIWKKAIEVKPDWIISRTRFFLTSIMAGYCAKTKGIKWIHIEHGSDFVQLSNKFYSFIAKIYDYTFGYLTLRFADLVVANSEGSAKFCKKIYSRRKYEVIRRGVEIEEIEKIKPNKEIFEKYRDKSKILYIGRLIDGKGVADLIEAVSDINNKKWVLFIIGDGPQRNTLEILVKDFGIKDKVVFFGQKTKQESIGTMKIADIVVNPSYTEGLPTSMIEAAICGKPVIATDVGGTNEIVKDKITGFLIRPKDVVKLRKLIIEMIDNVLYYTKMGEVAKDLAVRNFSWEVSIKKYMKILN